MAEFLEYEDEYEKEFFTIRHFELADVLLLGIVLIRDRKENQTFRRLVELGVETRHFVHAWNEDEETASAAKLWEKFKAADAEGKPIGAWDTLNAGLTTGELFSAVRPCADEIEAAIADGLAELKDGEEPREVTARFLAAVGEIEPCRYAARAEPLPEIVARPIPPPDWIVAGCFERGDKAELIAPAKLGKSFFGIGLALHVAAGLPYCGLEIPKARPVLYVNLEITADWFARRLKWQLAAHSIAEPPRNLRIWNARGEGEEVRAHLVSVVRKTRPSLVVIDPLYKLLAPGETENSSEGMRDLLAFEEEVAEAGPAVLVVEHDAKGIPGAKDARDRGAGTSWTARDCDCRFLLTPPAQGDGYAVLEVGLCRNAATPAPVTLRTVDERGSDNQLTGRAFFIDEDTPADAVKGRGPKPPPPSDCTEKARAWFGKQSRALPRTAAARDFGKEFNVGKDAARAVFDELVADGFLVERKAHGRGGGRLIGLPSMFAEDGGETFPEKFGKVRKS